MKIIPVKKQQNGLSSIQVACQPSNETPWAEDWGGHSIQKDARKCCNSCCLLNIRQMSLCRPRHRTQLPITAPIQRSLFSFREPTPFVVKGYTCVQILHLLSFWLSGSNGTCWTHLKASHFAVTKVRNMFSKKLKAEVQSLQIIPRKIWNISKYNKRRSDNDKEYLLNILLWKYCGSNQKFPFFSSEGKKISPLSPYPLTWYGNP